MGKSRTFLTVTAMVTMAGAILGACAYSGENDPVSRKVSWFDYVEGGDIRAACAAGSGDRYRFVHNAVYVEQRRTYDVTVSADGGARLDVQVIGKPDLSSLSVGSFSDLLKPWKGAEETVWLRPGDVRNLKDAMDHSSVFAPPPVGLQLDADAFWWTVASCHDGVYGLTGFLWPSKAYDDLSFAPLLLAWDPTGIALNKPRKTSDFDIYGDYNPENPIRFKLKLGASGFERF